MREMFAYGRHDAAAVVVEEMKTSGDPEIDLYQVAGISIST